MLSRMLRDYMLIRPRPHAALSDVLIVENRERTYYADVVLAGPGKWHKSRRQQLDVQPGDVVLYCNAFKFPEHTHEGTRHQIIQEADCLGRIARGELIPLHDKIVVEPVTQATMSPSGIILSFVAEHQEISAKVLKTGGGRRLPDGNLRPLSVKPGDTVRFGEGLGHAFEHEGKKLLMMREEDITCVC